MQNVKSIDKKKGREGGEESTYQVAAVVVVAIVPLSNQKKVYI